MTNNDVGSVPVGSADVPDLGDAELVLRTRSGDRAAFAELWRRHYRSGVTVARSVTSSLDPDDLVQEAYTRIYQSIITGGGPTGSFRAYLFTSIRNTAAAWGRARRETAMDALDAVEDPASSDQATTAALDHSLTHRAFRSLPTRWQEVLWYSEIEQMKPAEIAPLLGMKATAVAQLTFRAREGLREAWIQAHLRSVADGSDCQWTIEHLGAYSRANIGRRDRAKVEAHLARCARCAIVASEAKEVSGRLALVLLPLTVGAVGTAGYLASLQGGGIPVMALAAMPSSVVQGAVTILPVFPDVGTVAMGAGAAGAAIGKAGAAGAAGAGAAGTAAAGAGSTGAAMAAGVGSSGAAAAAAASTAVASTAVTATAGGIFSGLGAMAGLATAGLVVAGTVAVAAVVGPTPPPSANVAENAGSSIVLEEEPVEPPAEFDAAASDETPPDAADEVPPAAEEQGETTAEEQGETAAEEQGAPAEGGAVKPSQPEQSAAPAPSPPGKGGTDPRPVDPVPSMPPGSPAIVGSTSYTSADSGQTNLEVVVSGAPGATVQARIRGVVQGAALIGDTGTATLLILPSALDLRVDARVDFRFVDGNRSGPPVSARLSELL